MENVVQLEFLHVGGREDGGLQALAAELTERLETGSAITTVVRLYDQGRCVMRFLEKWDEFHSRLWQAREEYEHARGLYKLWAGVRYSRALKKYSGEKEQEERLEFAQVFFADQADFWEHIAIEMSDHRFRPVQDDEVYDLKTAISRAKGVWIFLFAPNDDLCADKNTSIAHAM